LGTQVDIYVAQGLAIGQLRKRCGEEMIQTGEVFDLVPGAWGFWAEIRERPQKWDCFTCPQDALTAIYGKNA
jgi:hypothetical protein